MATQHKSVSRPETIRASEDSAGGVAAGVEENIPAAKETVQSSEKPYAQMPKAEAKNHEETNVKSKSEEERCAALQQDSATKLPSSQKTVTQEATKAKVEVVEEKLPAAKETVEAFEELRKGPAEIPIQHVPVPDIPKIQKESQRKSQAEKERLAKRRSRTPVHSSRKSFIESSLIRLSPHKWSRSAQVGAAAAAVGTAVAATVSVKYGLAEKAAEALKDLSTAVIRATPAMNWPLPHVVSPSTWSKSGQMVVLGGGCTLLYAFNKDCLGSTMADFRRYLGSLKTMAWNKLDLSKTHPKVMAGALTGMVVAAFTAGASNVSTTPPSADQVALATAVPLVLYSLKTGEIGPSQEKIQEMQRVAGQLGVGPEVKAAIGKANMAENWPYGVCLLAFASLAAFQWIDDRFSLVSIVEVDL